MATIFSENSDEHYYCIVCDYKCSLLQHWKQHILTKKHKKRIFNNIDNSVNSSIQYFECECGKNYKDRSGLWRHKKKCIKEGIPYIDKNTQLTPELVLKLIEQNKELQQTLIDQNKTIIELAQKAGSYNTTNTNCGNNNKTFNLQVFLNETCKDAINMSDFVNQIQI